MKITFLDADTLGDSFDHNDFSSLGEVVVYPYTEQADTIPRIDNSEVIITNKVKISSQVMDHCDNLKLICIAATGTDHVDLEYAKAKGIVVKNAVNYSSDSVAEFALTLGLTLKNQIKYYDRFTRNDYQQNKTFTHIGAGYSQIKDKNVGIVGLGNIGKKTASLYQALGAHISYYSISKTRQQTDYTFYPELDEFLSEQDIVILHCPLTPTSKDMINLDTLGKMKPSAILINVSRGAVVCEEDLVTAIETKVIAAAAVDVYAQEPITDASPYHRLADFDNVILTPHIAWGSDEARAALMAIIKQHIVGFIS